MQNWNASWCNFYAVTGFTTEEKLVEAYIQSANAAVINSSADFESTAPVLAGIVFADNFINNSFSSNIKVKAIKQLFTIFLQY